MTNKNMNAKITLPNTFTPASERTNISAEDNIITAMSKSAKYFNDLGTAAYTNSNSYAASVHNQSSETITTMTGYTKPSSTSAITTSDTLNGAIGKLEKALDSSGGDSSGFTYIGSFGTIEITFKNSAFDYFIICTLEYDSYGDMNLYFGYITGNESYGIYGITYFGNYSYSGSSITPSNKKNNLLF